MRTSAAIKTRVKFLRVMAKRGMDARIEITHSANQLRMTVRVIAATTGQTRMGTDEAQVLTTAKDPQTGEIRTGYKSAKLLSGGERSYSTVSLLLALWESTNGPLRCLDEWDVFLDSVNRNLAAKLLVRGIDLVVWKRGREGPRGV